MRNVFMEQTIHDNGVTIVQKTSYNTDTHLYEASTEKWIPKIPWFRPPVCRLFRWAYRYEHDIKFSADKEDFAVQIGITKNYFVNSTTSFKKEN